MPGWVNEPIPNPFLDEDAARGFVDLRNFGGPIWEQPIRGVSPVEFQNEKFVIRALRKASLIVFVSVACTGLAHAQAPPGPMTLPPPKDAPAPEPRPQAQKSALQPRTSIFGEWRFNRDDSDDPQKKMQEAQQDRSQGNGGYGGGGPRIGYPGGMGGGGRRMGQQGMSDEERQKMQELMNPANRLTVADLTDRGEVDLTDDQQRKLTLITDGRKPQKSKDANNQEVAARWSGKELATDEKGPHGKMSRTYELSYDGTQLYETLHMTMGRGNTTFLVRYVYDAYGPPPAGAESAPAAAGAAATAPTGSAPKQ
jgi:hypothetical protein